LVTEAAQQAALEVHVSENMTLAMQWLDEHQPVAMLIDTRSVDPQSVAIQVRAAALRARLPVLALSDELGDLSFADAFSWGADDVVRAGSERALTARLRRLPRAEPGEPWNGRGLALVAEPDPVRRVVLARVLRNAGYTITFAVEARDTEEFAGRPEFTLVVLNGELCSDLRAIVESARQKGNQATWIVACAPRKLRECRNELNGLERVTPVDGFAPPENILFVANELNAGARANLRETPRLLYGTTCAFRPAGRAEDEVGYTYNISASGMYLRTLAPPEEEVVWLELCPPRSERRVRLVAHLAWQRSLGTEGTATAPPGFGVRIVDGARADLEAWQAGYKAVAGELN
jgi:DNA-binding response OmpR family regulator